MTRTEVLVFTRTTGYRHESIPDGVALLRRVATESDLTLEHTEDPGVFTPAGLARYAAVVWLSTSGDVLEPAGRKAFESYVRGGGGYLGVHSASATEYDWPFYRSLVGAAFLSHPPVRPGVVRVTDRGHPSTAHLPETWPLVDEWYTFRRPVTGVRTLARVAGSGHHGGPTGDDRPVAWCHERFAGRAWYTALGHPRGAYTDPLFAGHVAGGLRWVLSRGENPGPPLPAGPDRPS